MTGVQTCALPISLSLRYLQKLRESGIRAELYPDAVKIKKQMAYANARKVAFVAIQGEDEIREGVISLKNMVTGEQQKIEPAHLKEIMD